MGSEPDEGEDGWSDERDGQYRVSWDRSNPDTLPMEIVTAVASVKGTDPLDLARPLNAAFDPDALVRFVASGDETLQVTFEYLGTHVTVRADGEVTVRPAE